MSPALAGGLFTTDSGEDKEDVVTYIMEYYSAIKKNEIMPFAATWMDLESVILGEVKSDREQETLYDIPYVWDLRRNDTNELTKQRLTDLENKLAVAWVKGQLGTLGASCM